VSWFTLALAAERWRIRRSATAKYTPTNALSWLGRYLFRPAQALLALRPCDLITGEASTGH